MEEVILKQYPTLFESNSKGNLKEWNLFAVKKNNEYFIKTKYGRKDGALISNYRQIKSGKNKGKINETTIEEQTIKEADAKFEKQQKNGYQQNQETKQTKEEPFFPMLALDFNKRGKDISFPCFVQPKLDGVRGCMFTENSNTKIYSRNYNEYFVFDHIKQNVNIPENLIIDGELFTFNIPFEVLTGISKRSSVDKLKKEQKDQLKLIKFYVFDLYDKSNTSLDFDQRYKLLEDLVNKNLLGPNVVLVKTKEMLNKSDLSKINASFISEGYEGTMLRNKKGAYKLKNRSKDLQKYKLFYDDEFKIIDFEEAQGSEIVFVLEYTNNLGDLSSFKCKPRGEKSYKRDLLDLAKNDFSQFKNKLYTVRYQELLTSGCPRFPIGISFRDYE